MAKPETKLSEKEIEQHRDKVLLRMLKTPPKPHSEMKGKGAKKSPNESRRHKKQDGPTGKPDRPEDS